MKLSDRGIDLLIELEGMRLKPYDDQNGKPISKWVSGATIGVGHLIHKPQWESLKGGISEEKALDLLSTDLLRFEIPVSELSGLTQEQFDALVILAFNIGVQNFRSSTVYKMINNPDFRSPAYSNLRQAWLAWRKSNGRVMKGLITRREREYKLYSQGEY